MEGQFRYSRAVVCGIPASLPAAALRQNDTGEPVNLQRAREQHEKYVETLRSLLLEVGSACRMYATQSCIPAVLNRSRLPLSEEVKYRYRA